MKRFTETTKWDDPWFRKLSPQAKHLWLWLLDHCDIAGVIKPDLELASFQIGELIEQKHITELGDRLEMIPDGGGKILIPKFIRFQFGQLSELSKVHKCVIKTIQSHGLSHVNASPRLSQGLGQGLSNGSPTIKEKEKEKDKEKEKNKEGGVGEGLAGRLAKFKVAVFGIYNRDVGENWTYLEEFGAVELMRRPHIFKEIEDLVQFKARDGKFFPQSVKSLIDKWVETLDRARGNTVNKPKSQYAARGLI